MALVTTPNVLSRNTARRSHWAPWSRRGRTSLGQESWSECLMLQAPTRMGLAATLHPGARRLHGGRRKLVVPHASPIGFVDRKGPAGCWPSATVCGASAPRHRGTPRLASDRLIRGLIVNVVPGEPACAALRQPSSMDPT